MRKFQIPGKTKAQKLKNLDIVLERMARKMNKKVSVMVPPIVIPQYAVAADANGVIFSSIVPVLGKVAQLCLIGKHSMDDISYTIDMNVQSFAGSFNRQFSSDKAYLMEVLDIDLYEVSLVEVKMFPSDVMSCISTSIVLIPNKDNLTENSFIQQMDNYEYLLEGLEDES